MRRLYFVAASESKIVTISSVMVLLNSRKSTLKKRQMAYAIANRDTWPQKDNIQM